MKKRPRAAFSTLGCKVNQNETEALVSLFRGQGYDIVDFEEEADLYLINTCTVTHLADRKSRQLIRRCVRKNPQAKVVVMGCYAQVASEDVQNIPGVDLVIGSGEKHRILEWLRESEKEKGLFTRVSDFAKRPGYDEIKAVNTTGRARAYLKVQEGCEQYCTYCIIPYARGPVRSRPPESALAEAEKLVAAGFREIVLTGIHLGAYGRDFAKNVTLEDLLAALLALDKNVRIRLSSLEPTEVSNRLLELFSDHENLCRHLHLPLQSGHDDILQAMNRPYTTGEYTEIIRTIREHVPGICLTTDVMVGFPGETEEHFAAYLRLIESLAFGRLHVFQYSPRRGTPAAGFKDQIPARIKAERSSKLISLGNILAKRYAAEFIGREMEVLVETETAPGWWEGHSSNYLLVRFENRFCKKGEIVRVRLTGVAKDGYCTGTR